MRCGDPAETPIDDELGGLVVARTRSPGDLDHEEGEYRDPDLVIPGGEVPGDVPKSRDCPSIYIIYSSWAMHVPGCAGFGGAADGDNACVHQALANAVAVANRIRCEDGCVHRVTELWRGWECGQVVPGRMTAFAAVEVVVVCQVEL